MNAILAESHHWAPLVCFAGPYVAGLMPFPTTFYNMRYFLPLYPVLTVFAAFVLFRRTQAREFAADLFELSPTGTVRTLVTAAELLGAGEEHLSNEEKAKRERTRTATKAPDDRADPLEVEPAPMVSAPRWSLWEDAEV